MRLSENMENERSSTCFFFDVNSKTNPRLFVSVYLIKMSLSIKTIRKQDFSWLTHDDRETPISCADFDHSLLTGPT